MRNNDFVAFGAFILFFLLIMFFGFSIETGTEGKNMRACVQSGQQWKENGNHKMECVK